VASGLAEPRAVKRAAFISFGVAAVVGLVLGIVTTPWLILVGLAAIAAGWFYTGGSNPYGYLGLGEVFVFVFFGLVATVGTTFVVVEQFPWWSWIAGAAVGCWACALLVVNNLRDIPTDTDSGKRTLAVRLGDHATRLFYVALVVMALVLGSLLAVRTVWSFLVLLTIPSVIRPLRSVMSSAKGRSLIPVLEATGRSQLIFGVLLCAGLVVGG
jgi:1,4-dihydroxy-2-naphthoate octaprenyltransferase